MEDYVSTQFGKPGKLYQKVVVDNGPGEDPRMKRWQSYGPKATWVEEELYESVATSIILKNATLQEAFLIGRLCAGEYEPYLYEPLKTKPFTLKAPKLVKYAFKSTDAFVMGFSVKSLSKGTVQITMEIGL